MLPKDAKKTFVFLHKSLGIFLDQSNPNYTWKKCQTKFRSFLTWSWFADPSADPVLRPGSNFRSFWTQSAAWIQRCSSWIHRQIHCLWVHFITWQKKKRVYFITLFPCLFCTFFKTHLYISCFICTFESQWYIYMFHYKLIQFFYTK